MKNINIGIANLIVSSKLKDSYLNNDLIEESKKVAFNFFDIVKTSPILQLEFKVFNNIDNKHIGNDSLATRYIDNNIKLFEVYTIDEINKEHEKLNVFLTEGIIPDNDEKIQLYTAIDNLIKESLTDYDKVDVDDIHESFNVVLTHIKEPKKVLIEQQKLLHLHQYNQEVLLHCFHQVHFDKNFLKLIFHLKKFF